MDLLEELECRVIPGDGAMGTLLMAGGAPLGSCLEELCVSDSERVREVHEQYIGAGARLIRTNSFGANSVRLQEHGLQHRVSEINWSAAQIARDAAKGRSVFAAGSIGPLGITAAEAEARGIDRQEVFTEQMGALLDGGIRVVLLETFLDVEELLIALEVKQSLHHCPVICSLACDAAGLLPNGASVAEAWARLRTADADIVGVNCINGITPLVQIFDAMELSGPISAFPNVGLPQERDGELIYQETPESFASGAVALAKRGARLIGGCCGTSPAHIAAMAEALLAQGGLQ